ncbi:MAG: hypothetical protein M1330_00660 [Armatimonadetes bacterium]|nr:hypothetical protein [Armatimonadota bacterium]
MKLLFLICESAVESAVISMLRELDVPGYTRLSNAIGDGRQGRREGSPIWPGTNSILLIGVPENLQQPIVERLRALSKDREGRLAIKIFSVNAEDLL